MNNTFYIGLCMCILLFFGLNSCTEKENPEPFEAIGDVYFISKKIENKKQTALAFYAYGDKAINTAIARTPEGDEIDLDKSRENSFTRYHEPALDDYTNKYPAVGNYIFEIESRDGDQIQHTDVLEKVNLEIPDIKRITYEETDFSYDLEWKADNITDTFIIKLYDLDGTLVFTSEKIEGTERAYTLIENDLGVWEKGITVGNTYRLMLYSIVYEESADATAEEGSPNSQQLNIQEVSIGEIEFVWNQD